MTRTEESDQDVDELKDALIRRLELDAAGHLSVFTADFFWKAQIQPSGGGLFAAHGKTPQQAMAELELRLREERGEPDAVNNGTGALVDSEGKPREFGPPFDLELQQEVQELREKAPSSSVGLVLKAEELLFRKVVSWLEDHQYRRAARELVEAMDPDGLLTRSQDTVQG